MKLNQEQTVEDSAVHPADRIMVRQVSTSTALSSCVALCNIV